MRIAVTGAGGFIGHHLVKALKADGHYVIGADIKEPEFEPTAADEFLVDDLQYGSNCDLATEDADVVYALAANMGGMGWIIEGNDAEILHDNLLLDVNILESACRNRVPKIVYTSSACVYPNYLQRDLVPAGLREDAVYPADPQHGYGWEKLTAEKLLTAYHKAGYIDIRIARLHAIYGPLGTWQGGKEKAPAALCRKVAEAPDEGLVEIWGDGKQTRSFCYVDDCVEGLVRLEHAPYRAPLNIGSTELVTIDHLAREIIALSGKKLYTMHVPGPQGVRGRNSDNVLCREVLGWEPSIPLREGLATTYRWIDGQVHA